MDQVKIFEGCLLQVPQIPYPIYLHFTTYTHSYARITFNIDFYFIWIYMCIYNRPWDYPEKLEFNFNSIEKVKLDFLLSSIKMFPESNGRKPWSQLSPPKFRYFTEQNGRKRRGGPMSMNFDNFQMRNWVS